MDLEEYIDSQIDSKKEGFSINTPELADWALEKISYFKKKMAKDEETAKKKIQIINEWKANEDKENISQILHFESMLMPYAEQQLKDSKKRSFNLPSGTIGFRKSSVKFTIDGDAVDSKNEKLIKFIKENAVSYLVTKEEVDWSEFKKTLKIIDEKVVSVDGEVLDNFKAIVGEDNFYVKGVD